MDEVSELHQRLVSGPVGQSVTDVRTWGVLVDNYKVVYRGPGSNLLIMPRSRPLSLATAFTDGSGTTKDKKAGIGVYVVDGSQRLMIAENIGPGTNNRAELLAVWRALRQYGQTDKPIKIFSDSAYAIGACTESWQPNANANVIRCMREDLAWRGGHVSFEHIPGHAGHEGNEIADRLSKVGRLLVTTVSEFVGADPWPVATP